MSLDKKIKGLAGALPGFLFVVCIVLLYIHDESEETKDPAEIAKCGAHYHIVVTDHLLGSSDFSCEMDRKYKIEQSKMNKSN